jgi:DNA-binding NarL/FixJ family response regulator
MDREEIDMPFKSFETATIEVSGTVSSLIVVHTASMMRLGVASALRLYANLSGKTIAHGTSIADVGDAIRAARRGSVIIADVAAWSALEKDTSGLRDHARAERVAILLIASTDENAHRLLQLRGVSGVVAPDCDANELETAVSEIAEGKSYFKTEDRLAPATGMAKLSSRQVEILELMTRGLLNKQIAWELGVTEGTVKSHVSAILEKLGCDRRTQAIAAFLQSLGVGTQDVPRMLNA